MKLLAVRNKSVGERGSFRRTRKEAVSIRGQIDANNFGALVGNHIKESRVLMSKSIMVYSFC